MFDRLLSSIARALDEAGISYMVIGGQAVLLYGEPRLTRDIDITLGIDASALDRLLVLAHRLGLQSAVKDTAAFVSKTNVFPASDPASGIRVDFIFSFTPYEAAAIGRTVSRTLDGHPVHYAAVEDVIIHKLFAGRARDLEDIRGILRRQPELDRAYLEHWLSELTGTNGRNLWREYLAVREETDRFLQGGRQG